MRKITDLRRRRLVEVSWRLRNWTGRNEGEVAYFGYGVDDVFVVEALENLPDRHYLLLFRMFVNLDSKQVPQCLFDTRQISTKLKNTIISNFYLPE